MPNSLNLSKSKLLSGLQCDKRLWLESHHPKARTTDPQLEARLQGGTKVGVIARREWPDGLLVEEGDIASANETSRTRLERLRNRRRQGIAGSKWWLLPLSWLFRATAMLRRLLARRRLWRSNPNRPLFEGYYDYDGVHIRPDALVPQPDGTIDLYEVKSSTAVKPYHESDVTVQAWVLRQLGLNIGRVFLTHIDSTFVYPGGDDYRGLFHHEDLTETAEQNAHRVPEWIDHFRGVLDGPMPSIAIGKHCSKPFSCPFLDHCRDGEPPPRHRLAVDTIESNSLAAQALEREGWPRYYIDFETVMFPVPVWAGTRPFQSVPFQWSCHVEHADGRQDHYEFLASHESLPYPSFGRALVAHLGDSGPVFVYNKSFEGRILRETIPYLPELEPEIGRILDRMVDLLPLTRGSWNHPDMNGSWSLKAVLPTIGTDLSYGQLSEVADGSAAMAAIAEYCDADTGTERRKELAAALLAYCKLDTLAMVRLAHHLQKQPSGF